MTRIVRPVQREEPEYYTKEERIKLFTAKCKDKLGEISLQQKIDALVAKNKRHWLNKPSDHNKPDEFLQECFELMVECLPPTPAQEIATGLFYSGHSLAAYTARAYWNAHRQKNDLKPASEQHCNSEIRVALVALDESKRFAFSLDELLQAAEANGCPVELMQEIVQAVTPAGELAAALEMHDQQVEREKKPDSGSYRGLITAEIAGNSNSTVRSLIEAIYEQKRTPDDPEFATTSERECSLLRRVGDGVRKYVREMLDDGALKERDGKLRLN